MKKILIFTIIIFTLASCNELEKKVQGGWVVDQAYYHDEPVLWDLYSNGIGLNKDNKCNLPISDWADRHTDREKGTWKVSKKNGTPYLKINTTNKIFNRTFEIHNLRKVQDTVSWGYLMKMTLTADSIKLDCTKALYE